MIEGGLRKRGGGGGENSPISPPLDPRLDTLTSIVDDKGLSVGHWNVNDEVRKNLTRSNFFLIGKSGGPQVSNRNFLKTRHSDVPYAVPGFAIITVMIGYRALFEQSLSETRHRARKRGSEMSLVLLFYRKHSNFLGGYY